MDRTARRFDAETTSRILTTTTSRVAFEAFAVTVREELAPRGLLESIHADRVVLAAWRLREATEAERVGIVEGLGADSADLFDRFAANLRRQSARAGRSLRQALDAYASVRGLDLIRPDWGQAAPLDTTVSDSVEDIVASDQYPVFPAADVDPIPADADDFVPADEPVEDDAPTPRWQDRLVFDENVSDESPVVKGTWVTVAQIVNRIVDGFTWDDILRSHPELTRDDIRVCVAFAVEQESEEGRAAYRL
jgi:uncharacterized protein (DUF433 family)